MAIRDGLAGLVGIAAGWWQAGSPRWHAASRHARRASRRSARATRPTSSGEKLAETRAEPGCRRRTSEPARVGGAPRRMYTKGTGGDRRDARVRPVGDRPERPGDQRRRRGRRRVAGARGAGRGAAGARCAASPRRAADSRPDGHRRAGAGRHTRGSCLAGARASGERPTVPRLLLEVLFLDRRRSRGRGGRARRPRDRRRDDGRLGAGRADRVGRLPCRPAPGRGDAPAVARSPAAPSGRSRVVRPAGRARPCTTPCRPPVTVRWPASCPAVGGRRGHRRAARDLTTPA